jgi:hypothetical protein
MEKVTRENLLKLTYEDFRNIFIKYYKELSGSEYINCPVINWKEDPSTINVISIRCNDPL